MVHFDASVLSGESPVNGRSGLVSFEKSKAAISFH